MNVQAKLHSKPTTVTLNMIPEIYAQTNDWQRRENIAALKKTAFRKPSSQCQQMLDLGCGTGDFTRDVLVPWSYPCRKVVGVDSSSAMVDYARMNHGHSSICYEILDAATPSVSAFVNKNGKFDRIYSFFCLHWIKDQEAVFRNIGRLLKEDGECLLLFSSQFVLYDVWHEMAEMERWKDIIGDTKDLFPDIWHRDPPPSLSDLEKNLRRLLADAGMSTLNCQAYSTEANFRSEAELLGVLVPIVSVKAGTSGEETASMRTELSSRLTKMLTKTPSGCSVAVNLFTFHTQKLHQGAPTMV